MSSTNIEIIDGVEFVTCDDCGQLVKRTDATFITDRDCYVCLDCRESGDYFRCDSCEYWHSVDSSHYTDDEYELCDDCYNDYTYVCTDCGRVYYNETDNGDFCGGEFVCNRCIEDNYCYCDDCGRLVHYDYSYYLNGATYCETCYDDHTSKLILDYHAHDDEPNYKGSTGDARGQYIGHELEIDDGDDCDACAQALADEFGDRLYFERDGSLSSAGFEIISAPHAIDEYYNGNFDINKLLDICKGHGFTSHDNGNCGLHFHLSRTIFGKNDVKRTSALAKLVSFYDTFYDDILTISRRDTDDTCHWAKPYQYKDSNGKYDYRNARNIAKRGGAYDRYHAVNLTNYYTVEIRIFRGTLKYSSFMASLDFVYTIAKNSTRIGWRDIKDINKWLDGLKPETLAYIKERGAFMYADAIKGVA